MSPADMKPNSAQILVNHMGITKAELANDGNTTSHRPNPSPERCTKPSMELHRLDLPFLPEMHVLTVLDTLWKQLHIFTKGVHR